MLKEQQRDQYNWSRVSVGESRTRNREVQRNQVAQRPYTNVVYLWLLI